MYFIPLMGYIKSVKNIKMFKCQQTDEDSSLKRKSIIITSWNEHSLIHICIRTPFFISLVTVHLESNVKSCIRAPLFVSAFLSPSLSQFISLPLFIPAAPSPLLHNFNWANGSAQNMMIPRRHHKISEHFNSVKLSFCNKFANSLPPPNGNEHQFTQGDNYRLG